MFLFFSVARSQENGSWERAAEVAPVIEKPTKSAKSTIGNPNFGMNMPMMCSAFDTSMWLNAA
ncbi:hypothetical protein [Pelomonas cellulosilytica]|uniref:Uncharacterized protein n=1 Tax=Pelomonas cellulosilytica TaxID=2906762 RepID=A0ABS8XM56_9BURK|nr:hypothetical protein [Pelomonas sp. P8]MCE4553864.1 hypothetical protein [Pelomonas sp. P8]